jgi:hypothetical protein
MTSLSGRDLNEYDYISVSKDGIIPVSVKTMDITRLEGMGLDDEWRKESGAAMTRDWGILFTH